MLEEAAFGKGPGILAQMFPLMQWLIKVSPSICYSFLCSFSVVVCNWGTRSFTYHLKSCRGVMWAGFHWNVSSDTEGRRYTTICRNLTAWKVFPSVLGSTRLALWFILKYHWRITAGCEHSRQPPHHGGRERFHGEQTRQEAWNKTNHSFILYISHYWFASVLHAVLKVRPFGTDIPFSIDTNKRCHSTRPNAFLLIEWRQNTGSSVGARRYVNKAFLRCQLQICSVR